jgi:hypothetical protein
MKNGDTLEYKKKPPKISRGGTVQPTATYLSPNSAQSSPRLLDKPDLQHISPAVRQTIAATKPNTSKGSFWVPVRPGSAHIPPVSSSPTMPQSPSLGISDLDSLIDGFDDQSLSTSDFDDQFLYSDDIHVNSLKTQDADKNLHESGDNDDNGSLSFNSMVEGQHSDPYDRLGSDRDAYDDSPFANRAQDTTLSHNNDINFDKHFNKDSTVDSLPPTASSLAIFNAAQQKLIESKVNLKVVETILSDALSGIEAGVVDMELVKMYLTSAITLIRNI